MYKIQRNYRDAFNEEAFIDKYIEECFDKYMYIVGDISSGILRLKGFDINMRDKNPYGVIDHYLEVSCAFGCPYYILKRIKSEDEYNKLAAKPEPEVKEEKPLITPIEKENFDKDSLVLETSRKNKPNIIIDSKKINSIPIGELPADLKEAVEKDLANNNSQRESQKAKEESNVEMQTYVSASPDFDPSKKESFKKASKQPKANKQKPNNNANSNKPNGSNNNKKKSKNKNRKPQE